MSAMNRVEGSGMSHSAESEARPRPPLVEGTDRPGFTVLIAIEGREQPVLGEGDADRAHLVEERVP